MNPVIIAAIIAQIFIVRLSRIAGAITGYLITTGILLWGLSAYAAGDFITFGGTPLLNLARRVPTDSTLEQNPGA